MAFPVDEQHIEAAEQQLARRLPEALRNRLRRDNGGAVRASNDEWLLHPVWDPTDRRRMQRAASHILRETETARKWRGFPQDAVAVAANGTGDRLILRPGSSELERWDHETGRCFHVHVDFG